MSNPPMKSLENCIGQLQGLIDRQGDYLAGLWSSELAYLKELVAARARNKELEELVLQYRADTYSRIHGSEPIKEVAK